MLARLTVKFLRFWTEHNLNMRWFRVMFDLLTLTESVKVNYRNYKVYSVIPSSEGQVQDLLDLKEENVFDFWTEYYVAGTEVRIMVSPTNDKEFRSYASIVGLNAILSVTDVQELIDGQRRSARSVNKKIAGNFSFTKYNKLDVMYSWFEELHKLYPTIVTVFKIGNSYEGRPIKGVKIDYHLSTINGRPRIAIIEGGIHAREWISPATVTGIINEFLTSSDHEVRRLAESFEWHFIPVLNPDGYVYTFTENRLWRKNRNRSYNTACPKKEDGNGVDLNRNFDFRWLTADASSNPCSETFAGPYAFSEPESKAMAVYVLTQTSRGEVLFYIAFHSFGQLTLIPYSHATGTEKLKVSNYKVLFKIALRACKRLTAKHGTTYASGTSAELLYAVSGVSFDWVKSYAKVPYTFLLELRDLGQYAYFLPPEQIIPNNEEVMEWLLEADRVTRQLNSYLNPFSAATVSFSSFNFSPTVFSVLGLFCMS